MALYLYWYRGIRPTAMEEEECRKIGGVFRSREKYKVGDFIEKCDGVAGDYPEAYAHLALKNAKKPSGVKKSEPEAEPVQESVEEPVQTPKKGWNK